VTTYRLFPATNGPASPVSYTGNFLSGVIFEVTQGGMWFSGYWIWVPGTNGDTVARKCALWNINGAATGTLVPATTVTSGVLTRGQWNFVALASPVPLAIGTAYNAAIGWFVTNGTGFPDSDTSGAGGGPAGSWGTGGNTAGITNGPLTAFSDQPVHGGTKAEPYGTSQGVFSTAGTDPSLIMPNAGSNSGNFWVDVQVTDTGPVTYSGSYRIYPNKVDTNPATVTDLGVNYVLGTEFHLSQPCTLNKIWYYSPSGTTQLATSADIWSIQGASSGTKVAGTNSPSWSGAAGAGWISCSFAGVTLPAGNYKVSVFNNAASPVGWSVKDAATNYWGTGAGGSGITWGPLSAPGLSTASLAYVFLGAGGGNTPPFSNGSGTTERGQCTFSQPVSPPGPDQFPYLYVDGLAQNYWLDAEVTPVTSTLVPPLTSQRSGLF